MKEDYLWDKIGEDADIQGLENALQAFRYQETAPPALPAEVFTVEKKTPRRFFRFNFSIAQFKVAFAACAAIVLILSVVWIQNRRRETAIVENTADNNSTNNADKIARAPSITKPAILPVKNIENPPHFVKPNVIKVRQTVAPILRRNKAALQTDQIKNPSETLTAEEKYAYDQLMLALSITGSKLKIVKDKVQGIEETTAVLDTAR